MKTPIFKTVFYAAIAGVLLFSCVPARKFEEMKKKKIACDSSNSELRSANKKNKRIATRFFHNWQLIQSANIYL